MPKSPIASPARSQGAPTKPRRSPSRRTRSVGSPARSSASGRVSNVVNQLKERNRQSFAPSPLDKSFLTDNTDIEEPRRNSWWKRVEYSRDMIEVMDKQDKQAKPLDLLEEFDLEVVSQRRNYTMDIPESSGSESIGSIEVPQRRLFTHQENVPPNYVKLIGNRESMAKHTKTIVEDVQPPTGLKNPFSRTSMKPKPVLHTALLNLTSDKTLENKTKTTEVKGQSRNLFGYYRGVEKKIVYANFIMSESEDDISDIQPKTFAFPKPKPVGSRSANSKGPPSPTSSNASEDNIFDIAPKVFAFHKPEPVRRPSTNSKGFREASPTSITSDDNIFDIQPKVFGFHKPKPVRHSNANFKSVGVSSPTPTNTSEMELDDWQLLPSSTMIENQIQMQLVTPGKGPTLSKISEAKESTNTNLTKQSMSSKSKNKSLSSKEHNRSKNDSKNMSSKEGNKSLKDKNASANNTKPEDKQDAQRIEIPNKEFNESDQEEQLDEEEHMVLTYEDNDPEDEEMANTEEIIPAINKSKNVSKNIDSFVLQVKLKEANQQVEDEGKTALENQKVDENHQISEIVTDYTKDVVNKKTRDQEEQAETDIIHNENEISLQDDAKSSEKEQIEASEKKQMEDSEQEHAQASDHEVDQDDTDAEQELETDEQQHEDDNEIDDSNIADSDQEIRQSIEQQNEHENMENEIESFHVERNESQEVQEKQNESQEEIQEEKKLNESQIEIQEENEEQNESQEEIQQENEDLNGSQEENEELNASEEVQETNDEQHSGQEDDEVNQSQIVVTEDEDERNESQESQESNVDNKSQYDSQEEQNYSQEIDSDNDIQNEEVRTESENEEEVESELDESQIIDEEENDEDNQDTEQVEKETNESHDTTGRNRNKPENNSPEIILHNMTNEMDSFEAKGRNTSVRMTKSVVKNFTLRQSLLPNRESTNTGDSTKNSSAEGSGWDSHRTTRKTLRQTFGKDFTPRKSLRTMVMEKSAKRQTLINKANEDLRLHQANSTASPDDIENMDCDNNVEPIESDHEISRRTRQTTLEMYLQKIKKENERTHKIREQVREQVLSSLKSNPARLDVFNFPVASRSTIKRANMNSQGAPKLKKKKPMIFGNENLPAELLEDMQYKPPKRFKPRNASWVTPTLYKFLEKKLEPNYDYKARVRAEKLVQRIYNFTQDIRRSKVAPTHAVKGLKIELARLNIVNTHFEFYDFFNDYLPFETKIKVVPDIVNGIPVPKELFSPILETI